MIDIEPYLFTKVKNAVPEKVDCDTSYERTPSSFPRLTLIVEDNSVYEKTVDSGSNENHVSIMVEVNVYTNKATGKKQECKEIMASADEALLALGLIRTYLKPTPNLEDPTVYRMTARYMGVADKDKNIYRR